MSITKPTISWEALITETTPHATANNYTCRVSKVNANDPGYGTLAIGYYIVDFIGHIFEIMEINYGSDATVVRVYDILEDVNSYGPYNDKDAYVYSSLYDAALLAQAKLNRLDESAEDFVRNLGLGTRNTYLGLLDTTDTTFVDQAGNIPKVNDDEDALEFLDITTDWLSQYALLAGRTGDVLKIDQIDEYTADAGVTIDSVLIKDGRVTNSSDVAPTTDAELANKKYVDDNITTAISITDNYVVVGTGTGIEGNSNLLYVNDSYFKIRGSSDGILRLVQSDAGGSSGTPEGGYNYISFYDGDDDRQGYFGIDSNGNFIFATEVSGGVVRTYSDLRPASASTYDLGAGSLPWALIYGNTIYTNTINELTTDTGVTIDGTLIKDGGVTLGTGATVDTIETTLTDDDTHLPTSGAVYGAIDAVNQMVYPSAGIAVSTGSAWDTPWDLDYTDLINKPSIPADLDDLSDVVSATNTNRYVLVANGTTGYVGRELVEADISDLGSYITSVAWDEITGTQTDVSLSGFTDDLNAVMDSDYTAKGKILIGTGSGTWTALSVGSNDQVLNADSVQSSGLKWIYDNKTNIINKSLPLGNNNTSLWLISPKSTYYNGNTYIVYNEYDTNTREIAKYNHATDTWTTATWTQTSYAGGLNLTGRDYAHCAPSIFISSTGYIHLGYGSNKDNSIYTVRSTNAEDITAFDSEVLVETSSPRAMSYPTIFEINSTLVLFYRGGDASGTVISRATSSDNGSTWGNIIDITDYYPYYQVKVDVNDRIHLAWHGKPSANDDLYYVYTDDAEAASPSWKEVDGTAITIPFGITEAKIFDSSAWDNCYILGLETDDDGKAHIFAYVSDSVNTDKLLYFEYSGGTWNETTIVEENLSSWTVGSIQGDVIFKDGVLSVMVEYISDPTWGTYGKAEIWEWVSYDKGSTWHFNKYVTRNSADTTANPFYVRNSGYRGWFEGDNDYGVGKTIHIGFPEYGDMHSQIYDSIIALNTAKVTNATHTGHVTGSGALTIADGVITEAMMNISNAPTNDYVLTADDTVTGGWKWAAASGGSSISIGTENQIPHVNSAGNDFDYDDDFIWNNKSLELRDSSSLNNILVGHGSTGNTIGGSITTGYRNIMFGLTVGEDITTGHDNTLIGFSVGNSLTTGSYNLFIGYGAGGYETGSNKLFIDNIPRGATTEENDRYQALIYGEFNSTVTSQLLRVNGQLEITGASRVLARRSTSNQSISNATSTTIIFNSEDFDNLSEYNISTGIFTAQSEGYYQVNVYIQTDSVSWTDGNYVQLDLHKNSTKYSRLFRNECEANETYPMGIQGSTLVYLEASDTLKIVIYQTRGATTDIISTSENNHLSIHRLS